MEDLLKAAVWLGFFAACFFSYYYFLKFRNMERMSLIEKGADIAEVYMRKKFPWFIVGLILLGIGLGIITTLAVFIFILHGIKEDEIIILTTISTSVIFGSIGAIIGNVIENKRR